LGTQLAEASALLDQARQEFAKAKPNYIEVVKRALAANSAADRILDEAEEQHEAMERKRARAASYRQEAQRSAAAAESYIAIHSSDVESGARSKLANAQRLLMHATSTPDLDEQIRLAQEADQHADAALSQAGRDVSEADSARAAQQAALLRSISNASSSSSSSFGGGWGSSSGRSGGSSSFGGGGRGGGSGKW
jgi:uncharacterized membrane protein YgcG